MVDTKSAAERFAEQQAREAISQRYLDPAFLDSDRQEQLDKNRVLGEFEQTFGVGVDAGVSASPAPLYPKSGNSLSAAIKRRPMEAVLAAAAMGFAAALILR